MEGNDEEGVTKINQIKNPLHFTEVDAQLGIFVGLWFTFLGSGVGLRH